MESIEGSDAVPSAQGGEEPIDGAGAMSAAFGQAGQRGIGVNESARCCACEEEEKKQGEGGQDNARRTFHLGMCTEESRKHSNATPTKSSSRTRLSSSSQAHNSSSYERLELSQ